jgi:hypothetical protein
MPNDFVRKSGGCGFDDKELLPQFQIGVTIEILERVV